MHRVESVLKVKDVTMKKIRVLILTGDMKVGGIENQLMHLLRKADKDKFQIDFTSTKQDSYYRSEIENLGGNYIVIPEMSHKNPFPYCRALYRIMKDGKYDVVHSHELFHSGIVLVIAKLAGIPGRFAHAHNWQDHDGTTSKRGVIRTVYNAIMRQSIHFCANGRLACSTLSGKFLFGEKALKSDNYHLVFNSVDTSKFLDCYEQKETGEFCDDWCNVLQVGRVSTVKNQLFLTEIAAEFKRRGRKIRILCAGSGDAEYTETVKNTISQMDLQEYMQMIGVRSDIDVLMRKASAFVLPSRYEGMPLVLIEAQASGLPCVVADTFSHEVDFGLNKVRWLSLDNSVSEWADAIEQAIVSGKADKERVAGVVKKKRFDSRMFAQTLCQLYEEAIVGVKK